MQYKSKKYTAMTLMEIMIIFLIIGVITSMGIKVSTSKDEYMKNVQVYTAYTTLSDAAKKIASQGYVPFLKDAELCLNRNSNNVCLDETATNRPTVGLLPILGSRYTTAIPGINITLDRDPASTGTISSTTLFLQQGFCQRLAHTFNLDYKNINCGTNTTNSLLTLTNINNMTLSGNSNLTLPNGIALYIPQSAVLRWTNSLYEVNSSYNASVTGAVETSFKTLMSGVIPTDVAFSSMFTTGNINSFTTSNSTATTGSLARMTVDLCEIYPSSPSCNSGVNSYKYFAKVASYEFSQNKDFFLVFADINGRMLNASDTQHAPDKINKDIFMFRVYRDGIVIIDPRMDDKAKNILKAKVMVTKVNKISNGVAVKKIYPLMYSKQAIFASLPINRALCVSGEYKEFYRDAQDSATNTKQYTTEICNRPQSTNLSASDEFTRGCWDSIYQEVFPDKAMDCKAIVNKPNFFER